MRQLNLILLISIIASAQPVVAQVILETDAVTKNYEDQLPRVAPTEPGATLSKFQLADGFQIEFIASEPLVTDPVAMAFDERGRLFVVCMRGYSEHADDKLGLVRLLEDNNGDGVFDDGTDYLTGLSWPTAIACYDGGIFLGVTPDILYCKDTTGDGVADLKHVVFTGFGKQNVQGMLNSFRWGLDNLLYGATGTNGGKVHSVGESKVQQLNLRGRDFTIQPDTMQMQSVSGGAQHGATFDRWGERFVCSNSDHFQWIEFEDHHLQRNPLLAVQARRSIAVDGASAEVYRTSDVEPWRVVRTRLRVKGMVGGPVEGGGRASGYFTSASGITVYLGDAFEQKFREGDFAVIGDVGSNLVHLKRIQSDELNKVAARATPARREFLTSTDNWFRPVQFANAPDGALYVIDMYREVIEHPLSLPPMIKRHLDLNSGRLRGRIYRIAPSKWKRENRRMPAAANDAELVEMLGHSNGWHRQTAARLIVTLANTSADRADGFSELLSVFCQQSNNPQARTRALYCLSSIGRLTEPALVQRLEDEDPRVRRHALKLAEHATNIGEATMQQLEAMVDDPDLAVRYQLAFTLGAFDWEVRERAIAALAFHESDNPKMRVAILSAMGEDRLLLLRGLLTHVGASKGLALLLNEIVAQIGRDREHVADTLSLLQSQRNNTATDQLIAQLLLAIGRKGNDLAEFLRESGIKQPANTIKPLLDKARGIVLDSSVSVEDRGRALKLLCIGDFKVIRPALAELLSPRQPRELRDATVTELGEFSSIKAAEILLNEIDSLSPTSRRTALDSLTARQSWAELLLLAVKDESIGVNQLSARYRQRLLKHRDQKIKKLAGKILGEETDRESIVEAMSDVLDESGDVDRGRAIFRKLCASCHRLENNGSDVGPSLQPLRNRGAAFMLTNILDPNREIDARYEAYSIVTDDGQILNGILAGDTASSVSLLLADGKTANIELDDIDEMKATGRSLMPEGLERDLTKQGLADVIAYLMQPNTEEIR